MITTKMQRDYKIAAKDVGSKFKPHKSKYPLYQPVNNFRSNSFDKLPEFDNKSE